MNQILYPHYEEAVTKLNNCFTFNMDGDFSYSIAIQLDGK